MGVNGLCCALLLAVVTTGLARSPPCIQECPQDCGQTRLPNGCLECECGANPFVKPEPPRPPTDTSLCSTACPQDCGCTVVNNKATCDCTAGPNHPLIKPKPPRSRRDSPPDVPFDREAYLCRQKCQPDCGCTVNEAGEAQCHCSAENNPLIKKTPPPPPSPSGETEESDGTICRRKCPADCGCLVNEAREATCHCTSENHPLIKVPPPPPPPRPRPSRETEETVEDDGTICRRKCPADCGCLVDAAREATCHCTSENHPLIKKPPPPPLPPPVIPPRPSQVERRAADDYGAICQSKCPADCGCTVDSVDDAHKATCHCEENPFGRPPPPPPMIQCSPPKCEDPCTLVANDPTAVCPYCKCPA